VVKIGSDRNFTSAQKWNWAHDHCAPCATTFAAVALAGACSVGAAAQYADSATVSPYASVTGGAGPAAQAVKLTTVHLVVPKSEVGAPFNTPRNLRMPRGWTARVWALPAQSAPLGTSFLERSTIPAPWSGGAVIGAHGSWNRVPPRSPAVLWLAWNSSRHTLEPAITIISGFQNANGTRWGRPVDVVPGPGKALYVSDDAASAIYRVVPAR